MKSFKTLQRMKAIEAEIKSHLENIKLLYAFAHGKENLLNKGYSSLAKQYTRQKHDELMLFTLQNINSQIKLLETELATLQKYGK